MRYGASSALRRCGWRLAAARTTSCSLQAHPTIVTAAVAEIPGSAVIGGIMEGRAGRVAYVAGRGEPLSFDVEGWEHLRR